ncbi:hypothetical protein ACHQM5_002882 [Ranunculus cassubicifolius]
MNMECKSRTSDEVNFLPSTASCGNQNSPDPASQCVQSQLYLQETPSIPLAYSSQVNEQELTNNKKNIITSPSFPSVPTSGIDESETTVQNDPVQSYDLQNMSESAVGPSRSQSVFSDINLDSGMSQGRQQTQHILREPPAQNMQQYLYHNQLQNQMMAQKHFGNNQSLLMQSHVSHNHLQQQPNLSQSVQLQSPRQSHMPVLQVNQFGHNALQQSQTSLVQSAPSSDHQRNQQPSGQKLTSHALLQHPQSIQWRHQQKAPLNQQSMLPLHQNQQSIRQRRDEANTQQNPLIGKTYSVTDMQQQKQHQERQNWSLPEQINYSRVQQQQRQMVFQHDDISNFPQQQLGPQHNVSGMGQHSINSFQQAKIIEEQQKPQQASSLSFSRQGQRSQPQQLQTQVMSQLHAHQAQFQQQLISQNKSTSSQRDVYQSSQASSPLLQPQDTVDHQKQLFHFQRRPSEAPSASDSFGANQQTNVIGGREAVLQRIRSMKEKYMPFLLGIYKKLRVHQQNSNVHSINGGQIDRYTKCRIWLEGVLRMFDSFPHNISPEMTEERLMPMEVEIIKFIKGNGMKRNIVSPQQGQKQLQPTGSHLPQTQIPYPSPYDNQMNILMQSKNLRTPVSMMQPNNVVNTTPQARTNTFSPNDNTLRPNINPLLPSCNALHNQYPKQQLQQHQLLQQKLPQQNVQHSTNVLHPPMNEGMNFKSEAYTTGRHLACNNQHAPLTPGGFFRTSSPLQDASPRTPQQSSPQVDQNSVVSSSLSKSGTPLQVASSPRFSLSPSTSLPMSPNQGDNEKQTTSSTSSHSNAGNIGQKQIVTSGPLVILTPGVSSSPLLAEFSSPESELYPASIVISGKSSETEKPIERLIKVVKSMSHTTLRDSISDIESALTMIDTMAGSMPGNQSQASVSEDLIAIASQEILAHTYSPNATIATRSRKRHSSSMSLINGFMFNTGMETSDLVSTATSRIKSPRIEVNQALLLEINEINQHFVNTMLDISEEDNMLTWDLSNSTQGTIVKCSFTGFTLSQDQTFPVLQIYLLVSSSYPNSSPGLLDKLPSELSIEREELQLKAKEEFSRCLRCHSQPMSLREMAKSWDACARGVILEYALQNGGGSFSTRYGSWETVTND